ncbi:somatostatin receptor type 1-like [Branchiostoma floridae x Branchiostoma japonicum]
MRTACNVYVANLAVTDFALCLLVLIQSSIVQSEPPYWTGDRYTGFTLNYVRSCDVSRVIFIFLTSASVLLLTVIAVERYRAITNPLRSRQHGTVKHAGRICGAVWMVAVLAAVIDTIARNVVTNDWTFTSASLYSISCVVLKLESSDASQPLFIISLLKFLLGYVLPSSIIIPLYVRILLKVRQSSRLTVRETRTDHQAYLMVLVVTVFFLVTWLPIYIIQLLIHLFYQNENIMVLQVALLLALLNSVANPFLYGLLGKNFRDKVAQTFCCKQDTTQILQTTSTSDFAMEQATNGPCQTQAQCIDGLGQAQGIDRAVEVQDTDTPGHV